MGLGEEENIFKWELMIVGPPDTLYEGGFFAATLDFPQDFPNAPPVMTFTTPIWHPNGKNHVFDILAINVCCSVYESGKVCISILHPPGEDTFQYVSNIPQTWFQLS